MYNDNTNCDNTNQESFIMPQPYFVGHVVPTTYGGYDPRFVNYSPSSYWPTPQQQQPLMQPMQRRQDATMPQRQSHHNVLNNNHINNNNNMLPQQNQPYYQNHHDSRYYPMGYAMDNNINNSFQGGQWQ